MRKRGRPLKENARKVRLDVRLSEEDMEIIDEIMEKTGKTKSDIIRTSLYVYQSLNNGVL